MQEEHKDLEARESTESSLEFNSSANQSENSPQQPVQPEMAPLKQRPLDRLRHKLSEQWSIYVPVFVVLVLALIIGAVLIYRHQNNTNKTNLNQQTLSASQLNSLASANNTIGNSNQVLTVQSSAIFSGQVLVRGQLQVAGQLQISQLAVNKNLSIAGNGSIQGTLTVQNSLTVNGGGTFAGPLSTPQLTASSLQLNGDLTLAHHLLTNGSIPGHSSGSAVGSGGTTSVNGSDTAGTITINTGGGSVAGCYITVNFSTAFGSTPHVLLTPVGASSAGLSYYVNRTNTNFSVCSTSTPQSANTYVFDYFVID